MYVFYQDNPGVLSQCNDDGGGYPESRITFGAPGAPQAGYYFLVLRSYNSSSTGTSTLKLNGSVIRTGAILAGTIIDISSYTSQGGELNYFTAIPGVYADWRYDTQLFTMPGYTSPVSAFNDDYYGSGSFNWGCLSRIKKAISTEQQYCLLIHYSTGFSGTCDFYAKCESMPIDVYYPGHETIFPRLMEDDMIKSADPNSLYNCIAWSGGLSSKTVNVFVPVFSTTSDYDKFYSNTHPDYSPRYSGAENFTRSGVTNDNAVVAVMKQYRGSPAVPPAFTHAFVSKTANKHMHGYDWESKMGMDECRMFHPKEALCNNSDNSKGMWGNIELQYRSTGTFAQTAKMAALGINGPITTLRNPLNVG